MFLEGDLYIRRVTANNYMSCISFKVFFNAKLRIIYFNNFPVRLYINTYSLQNEFYESNWRLRNSFLG